MTDSTTGTTKTYCYTDGCPADHPFIANSGEKECTATCTPERYEIDDNGDNVCKTECSAFSQADEDIVSQSTYYKCVNSCDTGFYEVDGSANSVCIEVCESTQFAEIPEDGKPSQCVKDCKEKYFEDTETEANTPEQYRKCVTETANKYFVKENIEINN